MGRRARDRRAVGRHLRRSAHDGAVRADERTATELDSLFSAIGFRLVRIVPIAARASIVEGAIGLVPGVA